MTAVSIMNAVGLLVLGGLIAALGVYLVRRRRH